MNIYLLGLSEAEIIAYWNVNQENKIVDFTKYLGTRTSLVLPSCICWEIWLSNSEMKSSPA